ncbi:sulfite exporter TauE/SafE family protein [Nisaea acidiphila]|uniref:Probable membrane transporter protein n=1 Tax=Nisaea acidiphila TaxID=1862145 RepID=A0A9J7AU99_9PROT|nr:sulfite exporter TauE/SafE family protein [Nisaea acidiphila]UUX51307.1 sulfite exporter TauE/SafE family protein [Nisaea acidiphila]
MFESDLFGWEAHIWAVAVAATLLGGIVRGFTGFGFALILISTLLLVADPVTVVPLALILDLLAGFTLLPQNYREVHWSGIRLLVLGSILGVPIGFACLLLVEPEPMKIAIYLGILVSVVLIARGFKLAAVPGKAMIAGTGVVSGLMSGAAGIPGPPMVLLYLSSPLPVAITRATGIAFFIFVDILALALAVYKGLIDADMLIRCASLVPVMAIGTSIGHKLFGITRPETVKQAAIVLLGALAIVGIGKVLIV